MATAEEMAAYTAKLMAHTSAQNKPVTELAIFKLLPKYAADHAAARSVFKSQILTNTTPGTPFAKGILKMAWGFSITDPGTLIWMLDWDCIQSHWAFWQTAAFPPVMAAITELFVPGRPLVRHYGFGQEGMLGKENRWARVWVWDEGIEEVRPKEMRARISTTGELEGAKDVRQAFAVDVDEMTWYCLLAGFNEDGPAKQLSLKEGFVGEDHVIELEYVCA